MCFNKAGVALVDTPGADSINARHTDVAFQYIKNADAILFVTYYNHVFSRADREFLIQLGRVKDTFALDKMFFLINAADLAESEEELEMVKVISQISCCNTVLEIRVYLQFQVYVRLKRNKERMLKRKVWYFTKLWDYEV